MGINIPAVGIISFLVGDFEASWDSLAANPAPQNRGNFAFAMQSMILLEVACRVCASDSSGSSLRVLSEELAKRERKYFTTIPSSVLPPKKFQLPHVGTDPSRQLLTVLFDLIRNGQAHQYQQMRARLSDGVEFGISITGAEAGATLNRTFAAGRPRDHLQLFGKEDRWLKFRPDVFFFDLRDSIGAANLLDRRFEAKQMVGPEYPFSSRDLVKALVDGGHEYDPG